MSIKFDIKLNSEDMYRFNMYHAYTSVQGWLSLIMGILVIVIIAISEDLHDFRLSAPYFLLALIFLLYVPLTLRIRSKRQIRMSSALKDTLHFEMRDEGIAVSTTKHNLLIYSNRVNAYIIPKAQISDKQPQIYEALRKHCDDYRLHIKGE